MSCQIIFNRGIQNNASLMQAGLPAGSIAQGSLFNILGARLGPAASPDVGFPLSTNLGGVTVQVKQANTSVAAIPVFVSAGKITAIMPSNAPLGAVSIYVTFNNRASPPVPARVVTDSFGILAANSAGFGPGLIQNLMPDGSAPNNTPSTPAQPGQAVALNGTGLGPGLNPDTQPPQSGNLPTKVEVFVGGVSAQISYSGRNSCCGGSDQIVFTVPDASPPGCWVPVQVRTRGATVSNTVTMSISPDGSPCTDPANSLSAPFLAGNAIGLIGFLRTDITEDVGLAKAGLVTTDAAMLTFQQENPLPDAPFNPFFSLPPPGTCTNYASPGDLFDGDSIPQADDSGTVFLDAGATLTVTGPTGNHTLGRPATKVRNYQPLGYTYSATLVPSSLFLNPGNFTLTGSGGADVGQITAPFTIPSPTGLTWTNRGQTSIITRNLGFTVNWTNAPSDQSVIIFGGGVDLPTNSSAVFVCVAAPDQGTFTVPGIALGNVPATRTNLLQSKGVVYVGALPALNPVTFSATGLDVGAIVAGAFMGKTVIFQ
jgi:uncharacterized protein (TIGR03437 family)